MQEGITPKKINYSWIEIVPVLVLLIFVVIALAVTPNCIDNSACVEYVVSEDYDFEQLENVFNNRSAEIP